jgi:hypothetical protein
MIKSEFAITLTISNTDFFLNVKWNASLGGHVYPRDRLPVALCQRSGRYVKYCETGYTRLPPKIVRKFRHSAVITHTKLHFAHYYK